MGKRYALCISLLILSLVLTACSEKDVNNNSDNKEFANNEIYDNSVGDNTDKGNINNSQDYNNENQIINQDNVQAKGNIVENNNKGEIMEGMDTFRTYMAGTILNSIDELTDENISSLFYSEEITEDIKTRINGKSYGEDCEIPYSDLRYIRLLHWDFEGKTRIGELIVNKLIAEDIVEIFKELYKNKYPIERIVLVDEYDADDNKSMAANNSSAFNYRKIADTDRLSNHSLGLAIDINPLYNPYVRTINGKTVVLPENGEEYADRSMANPYYIDHENLCYKEFIKRGFTWGGDWKKSKDYQHFEKAID